MPCAASQSRTTARLSSMLCSTLDTQLGRTSLHHGVDFLGHNQQRYPDRSQPLDTEPVGPADLYRLLTVLRNGGQVVRVHSVEVGDHRVDIDLRWRLDHLSQGTRQGQIVQMVDIDRGQLGTWTTAVRPKKRCRAARNPLADMT